MMMSNNPLDGVEFAGNVNPRCPVVLLLDVSGSMLGEPILALNEGVREFERTLKANDTARLIVEPIVVTFGGTIQIGQFVTADNFSAPHLTATGDTPMGAAVLQGLDLLRERKDIYKRNGIDYHRPWMIIITDGNPTDMGVWEAAADELCREEDRKGVLVYPVAVENADIATLARFSRHRTPIRLRGLAFVELFQWLSKSLLIVSQSRQGDQVALPPVGWGEVTV